jgi:hypothetical protein
MSDDQRLPPDPKLPSSLSPGDRETLSIIVSAIDRHTAAMDRIADALEKQAKAFVNIAMDVREDVEQKHHAVK